MMDSAFISNNASPRNRAYDPALSRWGCISPAQARLLVGALKSSHSYDYHSARELNHDNLAQIIPNKLYFC